MRYCFGVAAEVVDLFEVGLKIIFAESLVNSFAILKQLLSAKHSILTALPPKDVS